MRSLHKIGDDASKLAVSTLPDSRSHNALLENTYRTRFPFHPILDEPNSASMASIRVVRSMMGVNLTGSVLAEMIE